MNLKGYSVLFGRYVAAGIIGYPFELAGIYIITQYLHIWYLLSAAVSLGVAFIVYFVADIAFGVIRLSEPKSIDDAKPSPECQEGENEK